MSALAGALPRWGVGLPVGGALALAALGAVVPTGWSGAVVRGAWLLLAIAAAAAVDEPEARLLDASPTPFWSRVVQRLVLVAGVVVPAAGVVAVTTDVPARAWLELLVLVLAAVAVAAALRRWTSTPEPALLTAPLLVVAPLLVRAAAPVLPDTGLSTTTTWWCGLAVAAAAWLVALRDPATAAHAPGVRRR